MQAQNQKNVVYQVEYSEQNGTCGGVNLDPLSLTVPVFSTVLDVMEIAARMGQSYQFVITFTEVNGNAAYTVDAINNTSHLAIGHTSSNQEMRREHHVSE